MRVIERFCRGKRADQSLNEDGLVITDEFAAVVDGVTSKSVRHLWRPSGGVMARGLLIDAVGTLPRNATMRETQMTLDRRLRAEYARSDADESVFVNEPWERLQANAVVYSATHREAWLFGDCQIMVNGVQTPTLKRVDELLGEVRSFAAQAMALDGGADSATAPDRMRSPEEPDESDEVVSDESDSGTEKLPGASIASVESHESPQSTRPNESSIRPIGPDTSVASDESSSRIEEPNGVGQPETEPDDPARNLIMPFLRLQSRFANRRSTYGYFVFDGFTDPTYPIRTVPIAPGDEVVLASDGYPLLRPTLTESERELARLRRDDPSLIHEYRSTKGFVAGQESFDDRTYLRFVA
ncbi:hypothetical protein BG22_02965 [Bifidobacterium sp. UTBIF-78]|nr:hypothetical protein BG22_02965 [Bifidobacterium sp. UTBIF-78]